MFSGTKLKKNIKKSVKIFGGLKFLRTFAARLRNNGNNKFIEKTENYTVQEASTEKTKFIEKR